MGEKPWQGVTDNLIEMSGPLAASGDEQDWRFRLQPQRAPRLLWRAGPRLQDCFSYRITGLQRFLSRKVRQRVGESDRNARRQRREQAIRQVGRDIFLMHQ